MTTVTMIVLYIGFPSGSDGKESACNVGDLGSIPGSGRSLENEMATHSSILAWKIPWAEEPSRLQSMGLQRVRHQWVTSLSYHFIIHRKVKRVDLKSSHQKEKCVSFYWHNGCSVRWWMLCMLSCFNSVQLLVIRWTVARQAPLPTGFSGQEYWSGLPCPSSGDLPHPGIEPMSLMSPALAGGLFTTSSTWEDMMDVI